MIREVARPGGLIFLVCCLIISSCSEKKSETLFNSLDSAVTHINFKNDLSNTKGKLSIVDYLYYYNGGGVAAGDINNDGLTDLFFISNMKENKLYLNKGKFQFEDVTASAGVKGFSEWQTGVTMADVNGDGFLDIYICAVVDYMGLEGANELYINNGDGTFTEKAAEFGLDFSGFSTQAAFFDYDHDGDLDMYLLNHAVHTSRSYDKVIARSLPDKSAGDYLYRNDNGKFTDVSIAAGIYQATMGYGLGICVADVNNDGWEDIFVTNDFHEDDYYYVNNGNGTFTESGRKAFRHFSRFSMGCDIADLNNDGYEDIMTLDMYPAEENIEKTSQGDDPWDLYLYKLSFGYHHQFSRNTLQISNGGKNFSDWSMLSGVAATDWSWSTLMTDYNNDGYKDIFVTNGIARRPTDLDYLKFSHEDSMLYAPELSLEQIERAISRMPEGKVHNYFFQGSKDLRFKDQSESWGMGLPTISNGAAYADLDNDGDLDLVTNNINTPAGIYKNRSDEFQKNNFLSVSLKGSGMNKFGVGAKVYIKTDSGFQMQQLMPTRGFLSSVEPRLVFGIGKSQRIDSLVVMWNDMTTQVMTDVKANTTLVLDQKQASGQNVKLSLYHSYRPLFEDVTDEVRVDYKHAENKYFDFYREGLIPFLTSSEGPKIAVGDVDGNGKNDFYVGGAKHQTGSLFLQMADGFVLHKQKAFRADSVFEDVDAVFADVDNDHDLDLYVVSGGNEFYGKMPQQSDRLYFNDGKGNFERREDALPPMFENKSCVRPFDIDKDGDLDLFVGGRVSAYNYGKTPNSYLLINDGHGKFSDATDEQAPGLRSAGMVTDAVWLDYDKDGAADLVVAGDWMPLRFFKNEKGKFTEATAMIDEQSTIKNITGLWQCLNVQDFDNDGDLDIVAGNLGLNTKLRKNGNASELKMYVGDFDQNGQREQIVGSLRPDKKLYPIFSKDEVGKQLPGLINKKYTSYKEFAGKSVGEIFGKALDSALLLTVDQFASLYFENTGKNTFLVRELPVAAQVSKIFALYSKDLDKDGNLDILVGGNYMGGSTHQNAYDASYGLLLKGDGKGNFRSMQNLESGISLNGQVRDIKEIATKDGTLYLISGNNAPLQIIKIKD